MFYNSQWKKEYLEYVGGWGTSIENRLKQIAKYEERFGKDVCEMNIEEVKSMFAALNMVSYNSRLSTKSIINSYTDWCIETKKTNKPNSIALISAKTLISAEGYASRMIASDEQLKEILDTVFDRDMENNHPNRATMTRLIFWLLFSGIELKVIKNLKKDDIDYLNKRVEFENITYSVLDEVLPLWVKFVNLKTIESIDSRGIAVNCNTLDENDYLFRGFVTKRQRGQNLGDHVFKNYVRDVFMRYYDITGKYMLVSIGNIVKCGIFHKLHMTGFDTEDLRNAFVGSERKRFEMWNDFSLWRDLLHGE